MALRQGQIALKDKITLLKQLDGQIIDVISDSKDEDVDNQVCKEIEESDEIIAEFEKTLLTVKATLRKIGGEQSGSLLRNLPTKRISTLAAHQHRVLGKASGRNYRNF